MSGDLPPEGAEQKSDKLQDWLLRFGSNPKRSYKLFAIGLLMFFAGLILLYLGAATIIYLQIPAVLMLSIGIVITLRGYLGILSNRLAFFRHNAAKTRAKYKHLE